MSSPSESTTYDDNDQSSSSDLSHRINSYDEKVILVGIITLLVVISFVLLLHAYAKWFLGQARYRRRRRRRSSSVTISHVLNSNLFYDDTRTGFLLKDGLDISVIASLPLFVYKSNEYKMKDPMECAICLSTFEEDEVGRLLPKCQHAFHVECIDMWLQSHSSCPICRAPVKLEKSMEVDLSSHYEVTVLDSPNELPVGNASSPADEVILIEMPPTRPPPPAAAAATTTTTNLCEALF